jgi:uncharacterized protein (TIGR03083 family)
MRRHRFPYAEARDGALAQYGRLVDVVAVLPEELFATPTRLGWTVAELVAHLAANIHAVSRGLEHAEPPRPEIQLVDYYRAGADVAAAIDRRARELAAGRDPRDLRAQLEQEVGDAAAALSALGKAGERRLIVARLGAVALADFLVTRCVEGVVHGLDLQHAVGLPGRRDDAADAAALRVVVRLLAAMLQAAAPGRSVEVRVPGPAGLAVQCVEGPRHTRGTPPNTVEADAVTFVEVTTGRMAWGEAVATGLVRASGARADLSPYLPLLR